MDSKRLIFLCCVLASALAGDEKYTDKYDNLDLDEIKNNDRLFDGYFNCLMERGKCTPEGKEMKEHIQDALETGCSKCTEAQEKGTYEIIEHLTTKKKQYWEELTAKYDPSGKWRKEYEERAKAKGIKLA